jgi:hypothetical protein
VIHTCLKYQGKAPLNNQYTLKKTKNRRIKWVLSGERYQRGRQKERMKEG